MAVAPAASGAPQAALPVVGPQFCAPYVVPLTMTKISTKISDGDFTVTDANGAVVLRVKGAIFSIMSRRVLLDAAGQPLLSMQEKTEMDIFLAGNTAQEVCDFRIKGSYTGRSCIFYLGNSNTIIAQMGRKYTVSNVLLGKDTFGVTVFPHVDHVFIAALVVILDGVHMDKNSISELGPVAC